MNNQYIMKMHLERLEKELEEKDFQLQAELEIHPIRMDGWMDGTHPSIHPQNQNCPIRHPDEWLQVGWISNSGFRVKSKQVKPLTLRIKKIN